MPPTDITPTFAASSVAVPVVVSDSVPSDSYEIKNLKVLHVINGEHYSGAERVQDLLGIHLGDHGFDVGFACLKHGKFAEVRQSKTPLYECHMKGRWDLGCVQEIATWVKEDEYELLHAHTPRSAMICHRVAAKCGIPWVYHVHSPTSRDSSRPLQNWFNSIVEWWAIKDARRLITVSQSLARHMMEHRVRKERISVVPNGVPCAEQRTPRRQAGPWTLGTIALFRPRKGTEVLIKALGLLRDQGHDVRLLAVGPFETDDYGQQLQALAKQLNLQDQIEWTGFTSDVKAKIAEMDVFALPSLYGEGLPMVVLEAMAQGVPVAATEVEGVPEALRHDVDGVLARPGDAEDLARQLERILSGELCWEELSDNAFLRHRDRFSDHCMVEGVSHAYRIALKG